MSIRHMQFKKAMAGDNTMLVWLGKIRLRQKEPAKELDVNASYYGDVTLDHRAIQAAEEFLGRPLGSRNNSGDGGVEGDDEVVDEERPLLPAPVRDPSGRH